MLLEARVASSDVTEEVLAAVKAIVRAMKDAYASSSHDKLAKVRTQASLWIPSRVIMRAIFSVLAAAIRLAFGTIHTF